MNILPNAMIKKPIIRLKRGSKAYKDLQRRVLARDVWTCQQCFAFTEAPPHHIKKLSQGGSDIMDNMVALCVECHNAWPNWKEKIND